MFNYDEKTENKLDKLEKENNLVTNYLSNSSTFVGADSNFILERYIQDMPRNEK